MDAFFERMIRRAATIDEILSGKLGGATGRAGDPALAERRLAAWCRASANGDQELFARRLQRDALTTAGVSACLANAAAPDPAPAWIDDAIWIDDALRKPCSPVASSKLADPYPFDDLLGPVVASAASRLRSGIPLSAADNLSETADASLRRALMKSLSALCAPALYERFADVRKRADSHPNRDGKASLYDRFIADMKADGLRSLFEDKPVLLRLIVLTTRQWIDATHEFLLRLHADLPAIRGELLRTTAVCRVSEIEGNQSDLHHGGRSVHIVTFEDGARVVYKPKDLRADVAWYALVERLNASGAPVGLKAARALTRNGYGWSEFIAHAGCTSPQAGAQFYLRAGAWLALFHAFAATDMHQENWIAAGDHPVPIDLEMLLQAPAEEDKASAPEGYAIDVARDLIANSVMMVGLLPGYARSPDNNDVVSFGGMTAEWNAKIRIKWNDINSDAMRPAKITEPAGNPPNLPYTGGRTARIADHVEDFIAGFEEYARFLARFGAEQGADALFKGFSGVPVRKVIRPTKFYDMLLQRLKSHKSMDDGGAWSAQADFVARLSDWDKDSDQLWPLQRAERAALTALNVPHFVSPSDRAEISDGDDISLRLSSLSGLDVARERLRGLDEKAIAWQTMIARQALSVAVPPAKVTPVATEPSPKRESSRAAFFAEEADKIAGELSRYAIRRGPGAAWIGLDWLGDADVFQLACLGPDLYNGASGIAVFLAAHAATRNSASSRELALAGVSALRKNLKSRNAARMARIWGVGGASGLGSIVYALTVMAKFLNDGSLRDDALSAAALFTDDLIAADKYLDVMAGSAGAVLSLLRLYRDSGSAAVLQRAVRCGDHLLANSRVTQPGIRIFAGQGSPSQGLNGMSHGAAGFAYALAALAAACGRDDFARAAAECVAFEDTRYDGVRHNWPDLRDNEHPSWPCQWCHGATGIGLARLAMRKSGRLDSRVLSTDIENAVIGAEHAGTGVVDTLCCGALGTVEFLCEAGDALGRPALKDEAARRLAAVVESSAARGDYRWNAGERQFNLGLFRGLAGVGYTLLRRVDKSLPNVLVWE